MDSTLPTLAWIDGAQQKTAFWRSESGLPPPAEIVPGDDQMTADALLAHARAGRAVLWQGDYPQARHLLQALARRVDRLPRPKMPATLPPAEAFARHRRWQGERAALLACLLVPLAADYTLPLRRGQEVSEACHAAWGESAGESVVSLRGLLAVISAHEWRKKGVPVPAVQGRIHPHFGVFSPVRGEYVGLVASVPLPEPCRRAFDIGTGSGILSAVLARRGVPEVLATDLDPRAIACATANLAGLGLAGQVTVLQQDLFPAGEADLVICNPPWVPAEPSSPVEAAVYDPDSRMLRAFLSGLAAHLTASGEGWLILSDLAEHLGLRSRAELDGWMAAGGLRVLARHDTRPVHPKAGDARDPLHQARAREVTSLWRLTRA